MKKMQIAKKTRLLIAIFFAIVAIGITPATASGFVMDMDFTYVYDPILYSSSAAGWCLDARQVSPTEVSGSEWVHKVDMSYTKLAKPTNLKITIWGDGLTTKSAYLIKDGELNEEVKDWAKLGLVECYFQTDPFEEPEHVIIDNAVNLASILINKIFPGMGTFLSLLYNLEKFAGWLDCGFTFENKGNTVVSTSITTYIRVEANSSTSLIQWSYSYRSSPTIYKEPDFPQPPTPLF
ncbi:MAG: hypothetical protein ACTSP4_15510 [Candidatus Hodarchaeales archaeon]